MTSHNNSQSSLRNPHFFKIILDDAIQNGNLMIPTNFVSKYGTEHLQNSVVLQVPDGRAWDVGLSKRDGDVWLQHGLREFMDYYSIHSGQFLTFRYEGNTTLSVTIFDRSATEIDYPYNESVEFMGENIAYPKRKDKSPVEYPYTSSKTEYTESEDNESVESLGENKPYPKRKYKSPVVSSRPQKLRRTYSTVKTEITSEDTEFLRERTIGKINPATEVGKERTSAGLSSPERKKLQSVKQRLIESEKKAKCLLRASSFTSNKPFFTVSMRPSNVRRLGRTGILYIRKSFAQKYLVDKEGPAYALLHNSDRTWAVMYRREASSGVLSGGWSAFVKDNNLKDGDVCVFQLLEGHGISLNVYIFRLDEVENCRESGELNEKSPGIHINSEISDDNAEKVSGMISSSSTLNCEEKAIAAEKASDFKSQNPSFVLVMRQTYIDGRRRLSVPPRFFKQHLNRNHCEASFMVSDERTWTFPLLIDRPDDGRRRPSFRFSNKWKEFAKENNLKVLDVCVFELIDGLRNSFRVIIFPSGDSQHREVSKVADKFPSEYPVHKFIFAPSHYYSVTVPWKFAVKLTEQTVENDVKVVHLHDVKVVHLQVGEKSWPVKFHSYPEHRQGKICWLVFARENSLQFGDVCVFELINQDDAVVKVSIFKNAG